MVDEVDVRDVRLKIPDEVRQFSFYFGGIEGSLEYGFAATEFLEQGGIFVVEIGDEVVALTAFDVAIISHGEVEDLVAIGFEAIGDVEHVAFHAATQPEKFIDVQNPHARQPSLRVQV